jgi:hypothetical protein
MTTPAIAIFSIGQQEEKNKSTEPPPKSRCAFSYYLFPRLARPSYYLRMM